MSKEGPWESVMFNTQPGDSAQASFGNTAVLPIIPKIDTGDKCRISQISFHSWSIHFIRVINKIYLFLTLFCLFPSNSFWVMLGISLFKIIVFPFFFKLLIFIFLSVLLRTYKCYDTRIAQTINPVDRFKF